MTFILLLLLFYDHRFYCYVLYTKSKKESNMKQKKKTLMLSEIIKLPDPAPFFSPFECLNLCGGANKNHERGKFYYNIIISKI